MPRSVYEYLIALLSRPSTGTTAVSDVDQLSHCLSPGGGVISISVKVVNMRNVCSHRYIIDQPRMIDGFRGPESTHLGWMNRQEVFPCRSTSTYAWTVARKLCSR